MDDFFLLRSAFSDALNRSPEIQIAGTASDPYEDRAKSHHAIPALRRLTSKCLEWTV
jgi:hypothetical protein